MRTLKTISRWALAGAAGLALTLSTFPAHAATTQSEFIDQASELGMATPGTNAAEDVLFPALLEMDAPPMPVKLGVEMDRLLLLAPGDAAWGELERWASDDAQKKVLEAVAEITDPDAKAATVLGIPFGADSAPTEWKNAGLVIELPHDGLLSGAEFKYLDRMDWVVALHLFESMRLASEGEGLASLETNVNLVRFGRIMSERPSVTEARFAYTTMRLAAERTRDLVYTYMDIFEADDLVEQAEAFDERILRARLMPLPGMERIAALQVLAKTFEDRGQVKPGEFARAFALLEAEDRPLRRLSEAARFRELAGNQADWFDQYDAIDEVFGDFQARWRVPGWRDPLLNRTSQYDQLNGQSLALVKSSAEGLSDLLATRTSLEIELGGTLNALGVVAFKKDEGKLPPRISAIEPVFVNRLFKDPYHWAERYTNNTFLDLSYFVPIRDQEFDRRVRPHPHAVEVLLPEEGESLFTASAPKGGSADAVLQSLSMKTPGAQRLIGRPAPELALSDWHNTESPKTIGGERGNIVVGIFWATWCGPCKASIPGNNALYAQYKDQGVEFIAICNSRQGRSMARTADQHDMAYPTGLDADDAAVGAYDVPHWPYSFIVDRTGVVRAAGVRPGDLGKALAALTAEQPKGWTGDEVAAAVPDMSGVPEVMQELFAVITASTDDTDFAYIASLSDAQRDQISMREFWLNAGIDMPQSVLDEVGDMTMTEFGEYSLEHMDAFIPRGGSAASGPSFTVEFDDSEFLLYSTGPDGMNNYAEKVGAGGNDILLWPPLMSLTREHMHAGN